MTHRAITAIAHILESIICQLFQIPSRLPFQGVAYIDSRIVKSSSSCIMGFFHPPAISAILETPISVLIRNWDDLPNDLPIDATDIGCHKWHKDTPEKHPEIATVPNFSGLDRQSIFRGVLYTKKKVTRHHPKYRQGDNLPNDPSQHDITAHITGFGCLSCCRNTTASALENQRDDIAGDKNVRIPLRP